MLAKHDPKSIVRAFTAKDNLGLTPYNLAIGDYIERGSKPDSSYEYFESLRKPVAALFAIARHHYATQK